MKNIGRFILSFLLIFLFFFFPLTTYAHFIETDGSISVTLHVDPNDNPKPGKQANLYFLFSDTAKEFSLKDCNCFLTVTEQDKQIFRQALTERKSAHLSVWGTYIPFIFPKNDVYHIALSGKPVSQNAFQPFSVS